MPRIRALVGWALAIVVALAALGYWLWGKPRATVPLPSASTSPTEFVHTFARALNDRDYKTAKSMVIRGRVGIKADWWDLHGPRITDIKVTKQWPVTSGAQCGSRIAAKWKQCAQVDTKATFHHWEGLTQGGEPKRVPWSYFLVRNSDSERWHILDWGRPDSATP